MIGNQIWKGRKHKPESKSKMGRPKSCRFTEEHKKKLSMARKKRITKQSTLDKLLIPCRHRQMN